MTKLSAPWHKPSWQGWGEVLSLSTRASASSALGVACALVMYSLARTLHPRAPRWSSVMTAMEALSFPLHFFFHVLFYMAHTYKELEDFRQALAYCAKAEAVDPKSQELWNLSGFCHFKLCEYDEAIECFEKAIAIDPGSAIDYANIGSNLRDKGDAEEAIAMYQKALSLDPSIEFARDSLKRLLEEEKGEIK